MAPRLIRRRPLSERISTYLNPLDFLLWLSEELDSNEWAQWKIEWATPIGLALNILIMIARANSVQNTRSRGDDVFGENGSYLGWLSWLASFTVHLLTLFSLMNAFHTFWRRRHYRLFENPLDAPPMTPSAHRVAVNSSPTSSSPLRLLSNILAGDSAESRSHPDATRDVWELAVWDPSPFALRMFCFFSPGHVLVYWLFLPTAHQDPRPSTTVVTTIVLTGLLTAQLVLLQYFFAQQSKDNSIIHKEVLHEYDTKFVHPRTRPQVRDVGIQFSTPKGAIESPTSHANERSIDTYSPTTIINKGFHPRPNPNYVKHLDPDHQLTTPSKNPPLPFQTPHPFRETPPPQRQPPTTLQPTFTSRRPTGGDGGSLGVYSHAHSPLRKAASTNFSELHRGGSPVRREGSPLKRVSMVGGQKISGWDQG